MNIEMLKVTKKLKLNWNKGETTTLYMHAFSVLGDGRFYKNKTCIINFNSSKYSLPAIWAFEEVIGHFHDINFARFHTLQRDILAFPIE